MFVLSLGMVHDNFLFVSDPFRQSLFQINLADESVWRFPLTRRRVKYVAYDPVKTKVYWNENRFIQRADLNGTGEENITARYQRMYCSKDDCCHKSDIIVMVVMTLKAAMTNYANHGADHYNDDADGSGVLGICCFKDDYGYESDIIVIIVMNLKAAMTNYNDYDDDHYDN